MASKMITARAVTWVLFELSSIPKIINACPERLQAKINCSKKSGICGLRLSQMLSPHKITPNTHILLAAENRLIKKPAINEQKNKADNQPDTLSKTRRKNAGG